MQISLSDLEFRRLVGHLHSLGPRALGEFIVSADNGSDVTYLLRAWERLTTEALAITGGDRWPSLPLHAVPDDAA